MTLGFLSRRRRLAAYPKSDTALVARYTEDLPQTSTTQQRRLRIYKECAAKEQWHRADVVWPPEASMFAESRICQGNKIHALSP